MRYAHIFKVSGGYELIISASTVPSGATVKVPSKKVAREMCARMNAMPWNF